MSRNQTLFASLLCSAAVVAFASVANAASAEESIFAIPPQPLSEALNAFSEQSQLPVIFKSDLAAAKTSPGIRGEAEAQTALDALLAGTGLTYKRDGKAFVIVEGGSSPQDGGAGAGSVDALIVTAQKREEAVQDVPIAISAFSQQALEAQKIEGGFDLLKAIPNVTFSKNNFSGYNFSIRGIGTKGISVATDPGVAVEFNGTALIRNRLFEQEYFDVERVEVLRGPQGTLHGRNATAGVINVISARPKFGEFAGSIKGEVGNYDSKRMSGFINVPLMGDTLALRLAGAMTSRTGYDFNETTGNAVNGRDLWSTRLTLGFEPNERFQADLIWERFEEDDNRSRTGKQLCHRDDGRAEVGSVSNLTPLARGHLSQGCKPGNLYDDMAFGTPNGLSIPFVQIAQDPSAVYVGWENGQAITIIPNGRDPYGGMMQSRDLRTINSVLDPTYEATTDVFELNASFDITDTLTLSSQTAYVKDKIYSFQDYNRFNTVPIFYDTSLLVSDPNNPALPNRYRDLARGGIYCDPQIGCSDTMAGFDISQAESEQFSQEFRLQSSFDGPFNFSVGANYTRYETLEDYYVMFNLVTLLLQTDGILGTFNRSVDPTKCTPRGSPNADPITIGLPGTEGCVYIDPNPLDEINGEGHNYFRNSNPYKLESSAAFGEVYWQMSEGLKLTAGLRYTDDNKVFTPIKSQLLLAAAPLLAGTVDRGHPASPDIKQRWGEFTGRVGVDWRPVLSFTDETMVYAFLSRGYKGGGANPPGIGYSKEAFLGDNPNLRTLSYPTTFEPEFVDALEVGSKNTLLGGAMILNATAFYYDYKDYQVSQIKERTSVNENFDATVWGLELETVFSPTRNLRFNGTLGFQQTKVADGETSLDLMDRTQGDPDLVVAKPWIQLPSNCVIPASVVVDQVIRNRRNGNMNRDNVNMHTFCGGFFGTPVNRNNGPNDGQGIFADLSGNELPNAPHFTVSLGAQYAWDLFDGWRATVRGDGYWQSQSWHRVYNNDPYDKLHGWYNANLSLWIENDDGLKIEGYIKNLLDKTPITDAFLNSDDTGLTTNVFVLDPRLIGVSVRKEF